MKKYILVLVSMTCMATTAQAMFEHIGREFDAMHHRMEIVFEELTERTRATKIDAPDYDVQIRQEGDSIMLSLQLPGSVTSDDISVEVEDDVLEVNIDGRDRIELKITGQRMQIFVQQIIEHEQTDDNGHVYAVSSGSANMSQSQILPARVDLGVAPKADLTDGVLTLTLAKKGPHKIAVTTTSKSTEQKEVAEFIPVAEKQDQIEQAEEDLTDIENLK